MMIQRRFLPTPMMPPHLVSRDNGPIVHWELVTSTSLTLTKIFQQFFKIFVHLSNWTNIPNLSDLISKPILSILYLENMLLTNTQKVQWTMKNVPCEWTRRQTLSILFPLIDNGCEEYVITLELLTAQISVVELLTPDTLVVGEPGRSAGKYLKIVINVLCLQTLRTFWRFKRQKLNGIFH